MENWDFREWQAALGALDPRAAALVGLAAAERIAGCLGDERFRRHGASAAEAVRDLLQECWSCAQCGDGSAAARIRDLADRLTGHCADYQTLSMTELFHSYGPFAADDEDPDDEAPDLDEFLEEAEPEGAVMMHLDALTAIGEAAAACAGGPWDGALRCLQVTAMAADQHDPGRRDTAPGGGPRAGPGDGRRRGRAGTPGDGAPDPRPGGGGGMATGHRATRPSARLIPEPRMGPSYGTGGIRGPAAAARWGAGRITPD